MKASSLSFIAGANKHYVFTALFVVLCVLSVAQTQPAPDLQWQKSFGGSLGDGANSIQETEDGGYITAGSSRSNNGNVTGNHGNYDYWIVKLSSTGIIEWQKSLGGTGDEIAYSIGTTEDGGFIVAGSSTSSDGDVIGNHGSKDFWVVKLDGEGTIQWQKSLGGSEDEVAYSIVQISDLGYIVAGYSFSNDGNVSGHHGNKFSTDYWIVKLSSLGAIEWEQSFGGSADEYVRAIKQTPDGGYIAAGSSNSSDGDLTVNKGSYDYWIIKLDSDGIKQWQKSYGGSDVEAANSIEFPLDGGYIVAGTASSQDGDVGGTYGSSDCWVVKLDESGIIKWVTILGGSNDEAGWCDIKPTFNGAGGFIIAMNSSSNDHDVSGNHGLADFWIVKLKINGDLLWQKSLGGSGGDYPKSILKSTLDDRYVIAGSSNSINGDVSGNHGGDDFWIAKLNDDIVVPPTTYITNGSGGWNDPGIWLENTVPPYAARVIIRHMVWVNVNVVCSDLKLEPTAYLTVNPGITITVLH